MKAFPLRPRLARAMALVVGLGLGLGRDGGRTTYAQASAEDEARRHFATGVKLYEDANHTGALAEFEASYRARPTAVALQNMALCQKELHRYEAAIATLERMLREFQGTLGADDRRAAEDAIREMRALFGTVTLEVRPEGATVTVNGAAVPPGTREVRLPAGEHRVTAEAPGHGRAETVVTVASGEKKTVTLELVASPGSIAVSASDRDAAIAIDGKPLAWGRYAGHVPAGQHLLQVYKPGLRAFERRVAIVAGQTLEVDARLAPLGAGADAATTAPLPAYVAPDRRGFYGMVTLAASGYGGAMPAGVQSEKIEASGGAFGVRGGYKFHPSFAGEVLVDRGTQTVRNVEITPQFALDHAAEGCAAGKPFSYTVETTRAGAALRGMTGGGGSGRFVGTLGAGMAYHAANVAPDEIAATCPVRGTYRGMGAFGQIEGGYQIAFGHWLLEGVLLVTVEGVGTMKKDGGRMMYGKDDAIAAAGLGIRGGWAEW